MLPTSERARARRFSVITPCRNAAARIASTMESVLGQAEVRAGRVELEYIVCDGGSTDGTLELVRRTGGERVRLLSEPDRGMYDALAKGLRLATGDVVSYLNAGDLYFPGAFGVVSDLLDGRRIRWLTGVNVVLDDRHAVLERVLPPRYSRDLLRRGAYGRVLRFVQQESTFWSRELLATVDLGRLAGLRRAGDFYLWSSFATVADLVIVDSLLGAFTLHEGQLSEDLDAYRREMDEIGEPLDPVGRARAALQAHLWSLPAHWKKRLNPRGLVRYDMVRRCWT